MRGHAAELQHVPVRHADFGAVDDNCGSTEGGLHDILALWECTSVSLVVAWPLPGCRSSVRLSLQGAVATVLGFFLLGGVEAHTLNITGIIINMIGGTWWAPPFTLS